LVAPDGDVSSLELYPASSAVLAKKLEMIGCQNVAVLKERVSDKSDMAGLYSRPESDAHDATLRGFFTGFHIEVDALHLD
jgi:hypothetical protein